MPAIHARALFGHGADSFEAIRASVDQPRPASVLDMAVAYTRDLVFDEPLITGDGVALGGHHTLTVRRDGSYRYRGRFRATGFPSFQVSLVTTLGYALRFRNRLHRPLRRLHLQRTDACMEPTSRAGQHCRRLVRRL